MFSKTASRLFNTFRTTSSNALNNTTRSPDLGATTKDGSPTTALNNTLTPLPNALAKGYMTRKETNVAGWTTWKRRWFVLTRHALVFYKSATLASTNQDTPRGDFMLCHRMTVTKSTQRERKFCLIINSPYTRTIHLALESEVEQEIWFKALNEAITQLNTMACGNLAVKESGSRKWGVREMYCVLDLGRLTCRESHLPTAGVLCVIPVTQNTVVKFDLAKTQIVLSNGEGAQKKSYRLKCPSMSDFSWWRKHLTGLANRHHSNNNFDEEGVGAEEGKSAGPPLELEPVIMAGFLNTRPVRADGEWTPLYYTLTERCLTQYDSQHMREAISVFLFTVNCAVFETKLSTQSFQLVTAGSVLHVEGQHNGDMTQWKEAIQKCINKCDVEVWDPLCREALKRPDEFYEVTFETKVPLGMVVERSGTWALVKLCNLEDDKIQPGSAINAINGRSVILDDFESTIGQLQNWQPPLSIGFRKSPSKAGWLVHQARVGYSKPSNWKQRYVVLREGHLTFYESDEEGAVVKGDLKLMGCAVTLVPYAKDRIPHFCFRITSSLTVLTMMATSKEHMMEWASTLYQAVAIANGGGYLLVRERKRPGSYRRSLDTSRAAAIDISRSVAKEASQVHQERKQIEAVMAAASAQGISLTKSLEMNKTARSTARSGSDAVLAITDSFINTGGSSLDGVGVEDLSKSIGTSAVEGLEEPVEQADGYSQTTVSLVEDTNMSTTGLTASTSSLSQSVGLATTQEGEGSSLLDQELEELPTVTEEEEDAVESSKSGKAKQAWTGEDKAGAHFNYGGEEGEEDSDDDLDDAVLMAEAAPIVGPTPRGVMVENVHGDDHDEEDVVEAPPAFKAAALGSPRPLATNDDAYDGLPTSDFNDAVPDDQTGGLFEDFKPLTLDEIKMPLQVMLAFEDNFRMKPVHFSQFVRLVTAKRNLFFEMDTFYRYFQNEKGYVDFEGFVAGIRRVENEQPGHPLIQGIRNYIRESLVAF